MLRIAQREDTLQPKHHINQCCHTHIHILFSGQRPQPGFTTCGNAPHKIPMPSPICTHGYPLLMIGLTQTDIQRAVDGSSQPSLLTESPAQLVHAYAVDNQAHSIDTILHPA